MTRKIDARLVSALLVGLLAFFTSWRVRLPEQTIRRRPPWFTLATIYTIRRIIHCLPSPAHSATGTSCATYPAKAAITITASQTDLQHGCV